MTPDREQSTAARSSTRAATRPSRSRSCSESGARGLAAVPSGASTGEFEAVELRDGGDAWAGKGVAQAVANVNGEIAAALTGARRRRAGGARPDDDRARRHPEQGPARRQRDPRRLAGGGQGRRGRLRRSRSTATSPSSTAAASRRVLPVPMMNVLNGGAHADNSVDFQEFMVVPAGADELLRVPAGRGRGLPRAEEDPGLEGPLDRGRRRGRLRARPRAPTRRRSRRSWPAIEAAGYEPGADVFIALDPATSELFEDGAYVLEHEGRTPDVRRRWPTTGHDACSPLPDRLDRGRHGRGGLGRLEAADRAARRPRASWSATTSSSPTPSGCGAGSSSASATRSWSRSTRSAP